MTDTIDSYVCGISDAPLLGDTIGRCLDRAAQRWANREALVSPSHDVRWTWRELAQRVDALARESLGQFHSRLHRQGGRRDVVHDVAEPVVPALGRAHLRALHEHDAAGGMHRRERVHHVLQVGRAAGAPGARFRGGAAAEHAMALGPF